MSYNYSPSRGFEHPAVPAPHSSSDNRDEESGYKVKQSNWGCCRVRVIKVERKEDVQNQRQMKVETTLYSPTGKEMFVNGDNPSVVPTDTQKNRIQTIAKREFKSIEEQAVILAKETLRDQPELVNRITVEVEQDNWERIHLSNDNGEVKPHQHGFRKGGPEKRQCQVVLEQGKQPIVRAGVRDLTVLKTAQSSFIGFNKCKQTILPDINQDRILHSHMQVEWEQSDVSNMDFDSTYDAVVNKLQTHFYGDPDHGVPSPSIQLTCWIMAREVLDEFKQIATIKIHAPNIHNYPLKTDMFGVPNEDENGKHVLQGPTDEPYGTCAVEISRNNY